MKNFFLTKYDIGYHFKKNSGYYISFFIVIIVSILISAVIIISSDSYINLLISNNKIFYSLVNGSASLKDIFWSRLVNFLFPMILIFLLGLNFYLCLFSFVIVGYQFSIFVMTNYAIISFYGFSGIVNCLFLVIPLNLLFFFTMIVLSVFCLERSYQANKYKYFEEGFNQVFFIKVISCFIVCLLLSLIVSFVYPLILKSAIFSIY